MAKEKTKAKPQTSAETERTYANAIDKIRDEMAGSKDSKIQLLGEGMTALLQLHPEWEKHVLEKGRTLAGALEAVRKNATGGCSDPIQTTRSLCGYYGIECKNPHVLALEVTVAMMGGEKPPQSASSTAPLERGAEAAGTSSDNPSGPFGATSPCTGEARAAGKASGAGGATPPLQAAAPDPFDLDSILGVL